MVETMWFLPFLYDKVEEFICYHFTIKEKNAKIVVSLERRGWI